MRLTLQRKPSTHEQLIHALQSLHAKELTYLIKMLKESRITNAAEAYLCIFVIAHYHPIILQSPAITKLCRECFIKAKPNQLLTILNRPNNAKVKQLHDQFVLFYLENTPSHSKRTSLPHKY